MDVDGYELAIVLNDQEVRDSRVEFVSRADGRKVSRTVTVVDAYFLVGTCKC
jgi:hypothetical protein